jgi:hypothetical protein
MKAALARPLEQSAALLAFARRTRGDTAISPDAATTSVTPTSGEHDPQPSASTEELDAAQIERTVARYRKDIERECWSPAREARDPSTPKSARVSTSVSIDAAGSVTDVTTAGDPAGYLHLAPCLASHIRRWRFPAAARATRVSIPFVFAGD